MKTSCVYSAIKIRKSYWREHCRSILKPATTCCVFHICIFFHTDSKVRMLSKINALENHWVPRNESFTVFHRRGYSFYLPLINAAISLSLSIGNIITLKFCIRKCHQEVTGSICERFGLEKVKEHRLHILIHTPFTDFSLCLCKT